MATDTNGVWSDKIAPAEFAILPAFYQTSWFLALCIAGALGALYLIYFLRLRRVANQFHVRMDERVNERTRIARELHDTLLQSFQGVVLLLQAALNRMPDRPDVAKARKEFEGVIDQAARAVTEGRDAVQDLRSSTLVSSDFAAALNRLGAELATVGGNQRPPAFHVEVEGTPRELQPILRDEVYRIACEALRNAFLHAQAHRVEVTIRYDEQQLIMRVRDDGKGIGPKTLEARGRAGHWGLPGMRERASKIGAQLELWSRPEAGTEMELKIPAATAYQSRRAWGNWFSSGRSSNIDTQA
jgi:signal transduction histidine kinase